MTHPQTGTARQVAAAVGVTAEVIMAAITVVLVAVPSPQMQLVGTELPVWDQTLEAAALSITGAALQLSIVEQAVSRHGVIAPAALAVAQAQAQALEAALVVALPPSLLMVLVAQMVWLALMASAVRSTVGAAAVVDIAALVVSPHLVVAGDRTNQASLLSKAFTSQAQRPHKNNAVPLIKHATSFLLFLSTVNKIKMVGTI